jgi:hypothetical protein
LFAAWVDEVEIANGFLMKAEEHGTMQRNRQNASVLKLSLREWNAIHLFSKSVRTFSAKLVMHNIDTVIRACFDNWKYSRYNKKRVQRQFRMHNVKTVIDKITLTNVFQLWQVSKQVTRMCEKEHLSSTKSAFIAWIQYCRENNYGILFAASNTTLTSSIDLQDSTFVQGLQEGNLDLTVLSLSSPPNVREQNADMFMGKMLVNQTASLLSCVLHSWNYVHRKARL